MQQLQPVLGMWAWRYSWDDLGAELNPAEEFLSEEPGDSPVPTLTPCPEHRKHLRRGSSLGVHQITLERRKNSSFLAKKKKNHGRAAQGMGGIPIPGGIEKPPGCGTWGQGLGLDLVTTGGFSHPKESRITSAKQNFSPRNTNSSWICLRSGLQEMCRAGDQTLLSQRGFFISFHFGFRIWCCTKVTISLDNLKGFL